MASPATTTSTWGILAEFDSAAEIFHACEKVRDAGFANWDAHTPFPVHGLDDAMGLKASKLPWVVLVVGLSGTITGTALQYWVHNYAYKLVISGKPYFAWPAYVPIIFEMSASPLEPPHFRLGAVREGVGRQVLYLDRVGRPQV
jgi:hypothetical protein